MIDVPELPPPPDLNWFWELQQDPRMRRYGRHKLRVALLMAYSGKCKTPGYLEETDSVIAEALFLGTDLDALHAFLGEMKARRDLRATMHNGIRRYEISRRLLPPFRGDQRLQGDWDIPHPVLTVTDAAHPLALDPARRGNRKWEITATPAERVAFSRFVSIEKEKAESEGRRCPDFDRDKFVTEYRAERLFSSDLTLDVTSNTPETGNNVTAEHVTSPLSSSSSSSSISETNRQQYYHHHVTREGNVTNPDVTEGNVTNPDVTEFNPEVYAYLCAQGYWEKSAREDAKWCSLEDAKIYVFAARLKAAKMGGEVPAWMRTLMAPDKRSIDPAVRAAYAKATAEESAQAQAAVDADQRRQVQQNREALETQQNQQVAEAFAALGETDREVLCRQAVEIASRSMGELWRRFVSDRRKHPDTRPNPALQSALDKALEQLIRSQRGLPERTVLKTLALANQWKMPPPAEAATAETQN